MLSIALELAAKGWRVFPILPPTPDGRCPCPNPNCTTPGKHPAIKGWPAAATTNEVQITAWWTEWPRHNIGIATGRDSNLLVLDVDGVGGRQSIAAGRDVPDGSAVSTGRVDGGVHHYYQCADDFGARNFTGKVPGLDARANGGYVIAAGSRHASGHRYEWVTPPADDPLPEPPAWLVELFKESSQHRGPISQLIPKGQRDTTLIRLYGTMRRRGMSEEAILAALRVTNRDQCEEPLEDTDLERIAASVSRYNPESPLLAAATTDLGNAERFVYVNRDCARWSTGLKTWLTWDGKRWAGRGRQIDQLAKETARAFQLHAAQMPTSDPKQYSLMEAALALQDNRRLGPMVQWARSDLEVQIDELDQHPWLLNCANGTLDLRTGKLRPLDPAGLLTHVIDVPYDPEAKAPTWEAFLERAMRDKPETLAYLQHLIGIMLTGDVSEKMLPIIWGLRDTGKSVLTNTIRRLLGEYAQVMSEATLAHQQRKASGSEATPDLARLRGTRLAVVSETGADFKLNEARIKAMTDRTPITARKLHGEPFDFEPTHKLLIETNNKPSITGGDGATWGRVQLIPFTEVIPPEDQDQYLEDTLARRATEARRTRQPPGSRRWGHRSAGYSSPKQSRSIRWTL